MQTAVTEMRCRDNIKTCVYTLCHFLHQTCADKHQACSSNRTASKNVTTVWQRFVLRAFSWQATSATCFSLLFLPNFNFHLLLLISITFRRYVFHCFANLSAYFLDSFCLLLALACAICCTITEIDSHDFHQHCPLWLFHGDFLSVWARGKEAEVPKC